MTNEIQQNRYDRLLRRVAGIIGPGSKVSEVLSELFPVLDVESVPSELLILAGTRTCFGGGTINAGAGFAPKMELFNPAGSNTIITLTDVYVSSSSGSMTVRWGTNTVQLTTQIATELFSDTRNPVLFNPVGEVGTEAAVAFAPATGQARLISNTVLHLEGKNDLMILSPGNGFQVGLGTNNTIIHVTFYWRERPMETSEVLEGG